MNLRVSLVAPAAMLALAACNKAPQTDSAGGATTPVGGLFQQAAQRMEGGGDRRVGVEDPSYGISAASLSIPAGWTSEGTVLRGGCSSDPAIVFRANSADSATGVQLFPRFAAVWSDMPGVAQAASACAFRRPLDPEAFVRTVFIPQARPGAQIVGTGPIPDDTTQQQAAAANDQLARGQAAFNAEHNFNGTPPHLSGRSRRIRIRYESGGRATEEYLDVVVMEKDSTMMGYDPATGPRNFTMAETQTSVVGMRAPAGRLDAALPTFIAMAKSLAPNPAWVRRNQADQQRQAEAQIAQAKAEGVAIAQQQQDFQRQTMARTQESIDRIHAIGGASMANAARMEAARHNGAQAFIEHMGDRQTVMDPTTGGTTQVSNQYNRSYYDPASQRIAQTNDPSAVPEAPNVGQWIELKPVPPR